MRKKFAITLICLTTILYGSILSISISNETRFFQEINYQLVRAQGKLKYDLQVSHMKDLLKAVFDNDAPPPEWDSYLEDSLKEFSTKAFYFFKVWLIESNISQDDIADSYLIFIAQSGDKQILDLRFPSQGYVLQFNIYANSSGQPVSGLFFPKKNREFSADYNNDSFVNYQDVVLARE
jgi:hypothetical protein